jgi:predicted RNase H-like HicB family nuclease
MRRSVTYTVVITRHPRYYVARCPALHSCVTFHKSRARAYADLKRLVREHVTSLIADDHPLPPDPIVSVKHLRLNLAEIREEVDSRLFPS